MCYVIYTGVGREKPIRKLIASVVPPDTYTRCFYTYRHMRKKICGQWADIYEWLIPGYLFVITDRIEEFSASLRTLPRYGRRARLLGRTDRSESALHPGDRPDITFTPVAPEEETYLRKLIGDKWFDPAPPEEDLATSDRPDNSPLGAVVELSTIGFDENDRVVILSGPMVNLTGLVRSIDLHRRTAMVEVNFMSRPQLLKLGFEILVADRPSR